MVLLLEAPDAVDAGDARHGLDLWPNDPVLNRPQVSRPLKLGCELLSLRCEIAAVGLPAGLAVYNACTIARLRIMH